ncbi:MAG TPA: hypothetical protein VE225_01660 [Rubrobacteraceae bacterium]|nr:hypothetical protein [Rubrobacteraceae bacterium]
MANCALVALYYANHADRYLQPCCRRGALLGLTSTKECRYTRGVFGISAP